MDKNDKMLSADAKQASIQYRITLDQVTLQILALQEDSSAKLPNLEVRAAFVTYGSAAMHHPAGRCCANTDRSYITAWWL